MRIALLYGDMEWRAGGAALLHYSASDYARRQGLHRQTVHADIRRLQAIGAITVSYDRCSQAVLELHGLGCLEESLSEASCPETAHAEGSDEPDLEPSSARSFHRHHDRHHHHRRPCRPDQHPCRSNHQSPGDAIDQTLSIRPPTLEKGLKTQEKRRGESNSQQPPPSIRAAADQEPSSSPPESGVPSEPCQGPSPCPKAVSYRVESPGSPSGLPSRAKAARQKAPRSGCDAKPNSLDGLLAELLDTFRSAAPAEWPTPRSLTLTAGRRSRLKACLAHAGSREALLRHLRLALTQVPPWFRSTYPVRPDGSRRPSHQFFDLLFRATAADRDGGPEAWHVFAWSEAAALAPVEAQAQGGSGQSQGSCVRSASTGQGSSAGALTPAAESDLQRAQRLFSWGGSSWLLRDIEALQIPLAERRRLTALLESQGQGIAGAGASQFAEASEPMEAKQPPVSCPVPTTPKGRHRHAAERDHGRPAQACAAVLERP